MMKPKHCIWCGREMSQSHLGRWGCPKHGWEKKLKKGHPADDPKSYESTFYLRSAGDVWDDDRH